MMRIAQVTPVYPPDRGGTGQVAHEYVSRLRARGHDVHVFTPARGGSAPSEPLVHRIPPVVRFGNAAVLSGTRNTLQDFHVVHFHYPFFGTAEMLPWLKPRFGRPAVVLTYHMDAIAPGWKGRIFSWHRRMALPAILRTADRILVSSGDYAASSFLSGLDSRGRVEVHPFGVDATRFAPGSEPDLRRALGIPDTDVVLLFVGAIDAAHRFKGLDVLFRGLVNLHEFKWHLVVVGEGSDRSRYEWQVRRAGLSHRVTFAGAVSGDQIPRYYRCADVHLLPSVSRSEAFGLVTLEAAASGVPSIVADLPGARDNVVDGVTGILIPPGNAVSLGAAIRRLGCSPDLRKSLGAAARGIALHKSWEPLIDRLEHLYRTVIMQSDPAGAPSAGGDNVTAEICDSFGGEKWPAPRV